MFDHLHIYDRTERLLVGCADVVLDVAGAGVRLLSSSAAPRPPRSILVLRLERIGDLLMSIGPLEAIRARAPDAKIHLVVGSWNADIAALLTCVDTVETLDVPWLARGAAANAHATLGRRAWSWRSKRFDLAINAEPDVRSNALLALSGAARRIGFRSAGGGGLLTDALDYDPRRHTAGNIMRLVDVALPPARDTRGVRLQPDEGLAATPSSQTDTAGTGRLRIPDEARREARQVLGEWADRSLLIGVHVSGGRPVKQWPVERFAETATRLAVEHAATIVLTGSAADRVLTDRLVPMIPAGVRVVNAAGAMSLPVMGGLLEQVQLLVTGDTGPMHLAAAVGTPVVAIFGPSDPARYGPLSNRARVVTADLWCRPCNRVRLPPERCARGTPDCLDLVSVDMVVQAARLLLAERRR